MALRSALYFHLLLLTADGRMSHQREPMFCKVSSDNRVDLLNQHLTEVPRNLPRSTQYLDLSHNNITHLHGQDLMGLPDLCVLKITHNGLQDISPSVFQGNPKVQILNISYNALRIIPELNLPNLIILDISENLYGSYTLRKSYKDLLSLSYLALGSPQARSVHLADFAPLHEISLRKLQLGGGVELDHYEAGSLAQLPVIQDLTLKMTFCEHPEAFQSILQDLDQTKTESLTLIKFVPDLCNVSSDITDKLRNMTYLGNLTFQDTWFNSSVLAKVVCNIIQSPVKALLFLNITYAEDTDGFKIHDIPGQKDSEWVDNQLVPNLEAAQFSLCIHERDFVPGDWIIDNIINCVERSYKTLFVLSHNFVQSEWCNYELFFAQHRAMSIQQDSLVFILLEPIPTDSLPKKFLKLRTLLRQQTYLEWHKDERKQQVFWVSLRSMLKTADKNMVLERVAKEMT
ncbi:toll-like receptor 1-like, partial [Scleropages formosus]